MMRATLYHFRGEPHEPVKIGLSGPTNDNGGFASITMKQQGVSFALDTDDPAWLEELEGTIREARLHLEARGNLRAVS